ncbi:hypothetical protein [Pseudonocardia abyssalis]|uniref:Uncharacterized protein n=1 Tax=Pseudonocardia abyssalis TaxID=2792008 RepID=A0ABS6V1N1_9PSEU|nr:hypothetical protein [Pseudonocardia abyssalis]MBW0116106.1 hypothetical protein [Pseudonocardia abyssalis]MBW0137894.1 hypothetical protein [Pseudonocardia abyssalis]
MSWVAVGVTTWMATSVPLALLVGAAIRAGGTTAPRRGAARHVPSHIRYAAGCTGRRVVPDAA